MKRFLKILKLVGIPFIIAFGIYIFIRFVWLADENKDFKFESINTEEYLNLYYESKESIVLAFKDDTKKKSEYEEIIRSKFYGKHINIYYYNLTNLTESELTDFEAATGLDTVKKYDLPILIYTLKGQAYDILEGYQESHYVQDFIERNNIG